MRKTRSNTSSNHPILRFYRQRVHNIFRVIQIMVF